MIDVRHEALLLLDGRGALLDTAREISRILKRRRLRGAIIGGVAVVLHGHTRTTRQIDVYVADPKAARDALAGFRDIRFVNLDHPPRRLVEIERITTVNLVDLINMKLRSGLSSIVRAQDLADVIGLIRHHELKATFASKIDKEFRAEFKKLVKALR